MSNKYKSVVIMMLLFIIAVATIISVFSYFYSAPELVEWTFDIPPYEGATKAFFFASTHDELFSENLGTSYQGNFIIISFADKSNIKNTVNLPYTIHGKLVANGRLVCVEVTYFILKESLNGTHIEPLYEYIQQYYQFRITK